MPATPRAFGRATAIVSAAAAAIILSGCSFLFPPRVDTLGPSDSASSGSSSSDASEPSDSTPDEQSTDVFAIAVGDCLNETAGDTVSEVPQVDCAAPHDYEVYYDFELRGGDSYPGEDQVQAEADTACQIAFDSFVGISYEDSALDFTYYYPTEKSWTRSSDRLVSCIVADPGVKTVGSLENTAR
jgi:hypothetical protein